MNINIEKIPFSVRGTYLAFNADPISAGNGVWLRTLIRPEWGTGRKKVSDHVLRFVPVSKSGVFMSYRIECDGHELKLITAEGYVRLYFTGFSEVRAEFHNAGLVIEYNHDDSCMKNIKSTASRFEGYLPLTFYDVSINATGANITAECDCNRLLIKSDDGSGFIDIAAWHRFVGYPKGKFSLTSPDLSRADFAEFARAYKVGSASKELALYLLWAAEYAACGNLTVDACAISKLSMNLIWSWDNCFIALASLKGHGQKAWNNIKLFFDLQQKDGRLFDAVNPYLKVDWIVKPPVHGYFIGKMLDSMDIAAEQLSFYLDALIRWSDWWLDNSKGGLACYKHPFDSGWDNATCFDDGGGLITPDLNAYLVLQLKTVVRIADMLGRKEISEMYGKKADALLSLLQTELWDGEKFVCKTADNKTVKTESLLRMMPVALGKYLDKGIAKKLCAELSRENHFLTSKSLATESVGSRLFDHRRGELSKPNPYWRGPVWAPPVYFIYEGLKELGEDTTAELIRKRYCSAIETFPDAIYENYDSLMDKGYDDSAYLWTAAVYVLFTEGKT